MIELGCLLSIASSARPFEPRRMDTKKFAKWRLWSHYYKRLFISGILYHIPDRFLYHPDQPATARIYVQSPSTLGLTFENLYIKSKDSVRLHMFFIKQVSETLTASSPTVLYLHGNAGNIGHRLSNVKDWVQKLGCNVCLLEYRGYGHSDGSPNEEGLYMDAQAALDYLVGRPDVDQRKIIIFGRSLGMSVEHHKTHKN